MPARLNDKTVRSLANHRAMSIVKPPRLSGSLESGVWSLG